MDKLATKKALANIAKALNSKVGDSNARIDEIISNMDFMTGRDIINILESIGGELPYGFQYFTVEALGNGNITLNMSEMKYSTDGGTTWNTWDNGGGSGLAVTTGDKIMFNSTKDGRNNHTGGLQSSCDIKVYGNVNTVSLGDAFLDEQTYYGAPLFFKNNTHLVDAENLVINNPLKDLAPRAWDMFNGCTNLVKVPRLTGKVAEYGGCYSYMFQNCTSLVTPPVIDLEEAIKGREYMDMFKGCTSLTTAPDLSKLIKIQASEVFESMFEGCTSLTKAPKLNLGSAYISGSHVCNYMFKDCSALNDVSDLTLRGGEIGSWVYNEMFENCTSLTHVPQFSSAVLTAMSTSQPVFDKMFLGCTSLLDVVPGEYKDLGSSISGHFSGMYKGCTAITDASSIKITRISKGTCSNMFANCTSLTKSPEIDLTDQVQEWAPQNKWDSDYLGSAFYSAFSRCSSLNYVKCIIPGYPNANSNMSAGMFGYAGDSSAWLYGVSATGTFVRGNNATWWPTAADGIPSGWTVQNS